MNNVKKIEHKVEAALNSLEGMQPATPGPFFFTRVQARLLKTERNVWEKLSAFLSQPVIAFTVICLVVLMNAVAIFQHFEAPPTYAEQSEQLGYDELNVASNSFYEYEIKEP